MYWFNNTFQPGAEKMGNHDFSDFSDFLIFLIVHENTELT